MIRPSSISPWILKIDKNGGGCLEWGNFGKVSKFPEKTFDFKDVYDEKIKNRD